MNVLFVAGFAMITSDPAVSAKLYRDDLGLPLEGEEGYLSTDALAGVNHLGVWPLSAAAKSCFGTETWPDGAPVPQATIEFEVGSPEAVKAAGEELRAKGYELVHDAREEPWGQTLVRLMGPEGLLIGISFTPWLHENELDEGS